MWQTVDTHKQRQLRGSRGCQLGLCLVIINLCLFINLSAWCVHLLNIRHIGAVQLEGSWKQLFFLIAILIFIVVCRSILSYWISLHQYRFMDSRKKNYFIIIHGFLVSKTMYFWKIRLEISWNVTYHYRDTLPFKSLGLVRIFLNKMITFIQQ